MTDRLGSVRVNSAGWWSQTVVPVVTDRLGSVRANANGEKFSYLPYGQEWPSSARDRTKFGTYFDDGVTAEDYADQRFYNPWFGRFNSPDPKLNVNLVDPGSWNQYAYTQGDPVNFNDPSGMNMAADGPPDFGGGVGFSWGIVSFQPVENPTPTFSFWPVPGSGGGGGGGGAGGDSGSPTTDRWSQLSADCQKGLTDALSVAPGVSDKTAHILRIQALDNALMYAGVLEDTVFGSGIDWTMLAAIGIRETGFYNKLQNGGAGAGIWQIDLGQHKDVDLGAAMDAPWAAYWVTSFLQGNLTQIKSSLPNLTGSALTQTLAASYNHGVSGVINDVRHHRSPDVHTTHHNYGANILNLMDCFH